MILWRTAGIWPTNASLQAERAGRMADWTINNYKAVSGSTHTYLVIHLSWKVIISHWKASIWSTLPHQIYPQFSPSILERIREATSNHPELVSLKLVVYKGWPTSIKQVPKLLHPYWSFRDEIAIEILHQLHAAQLTRELKRPNWEHDHHSTGKTWMTTLRNQQCRVRHARHIKQVMPRSP